MIRGLQYAKVPTAAVVGHQRNVIEFHAGAQHSTWGADQYRDLFADMFSNCLTTCPALIFAVTSFDTLRASPGYFFKNMLPKMLESAAAYEAAVPRLPLLLVDYNHTVALTKRQCFSILSAGFLCAFPFAEPPTKGQDQFHFRESQLMPTINYDQLHAAAADSAQAQKLILQLEYFDVMSKQVEANDPSIDDTTTALQISRRQAAPLSLDSPAAAMPLSPVVMHNLGESIDDQWDMFRIDFANQFIGGGSLGRGCVQEEIMFSICPELNVSRLICEKMSDHEAIILTNSEQFSFIQPGTYGWSTKHQGPRRHCQYPNVIVAIDALYFRQRHDAFEFSRKGIERELLKARAGFEVKHNGGGMRNAVATGNWGCGAFNGDFELKLLIQWLAASLAGKELHYFPFDHKGLFEKFPPLARALVEKEGGFTCQDLWAFLQQEGDSQRRRPMFAALAEVFKLKNKI